MIGTIHLLNKNHLEAKDYLLKAQNIFEQRGQLKLLKEVKTKLKLLTPGKLNSMMSEGGLKAAQALGVNSTGAMSGLQGVMDSDEDPMVEAVQMDQAPRRGKVGKKGKKKNSSVTGNSSNQAMMQRKVFNNFMDKWRENGISFRRTIQTDTHFTTMASTIKINSSLK